jgi:hypothetical protein
MSISIQILNQVHEIKEKIKSSPLEEKLIRNLDRLIHICEEDGYSMYNPHGEIYTETRTDCEANITGNNPLPKIIQVIKPILFHEVNGQKTIVQKAIVIVG